MAHVLIIDYDSQLREQAMHVFQENGIGVDSLLDGSEGVGMAGTKKVRSGFCKYAAAGFNEWPGSYNQDPFRPAQVAHIVALSDSNGLRTLAMVKKAGANELQVKPVALEFLHQLSDRVFRTNLVKSTEKNLAEKPMPGKPETEIPAPLLFRRIHARRRHRRFRRSLQRHGRQPQSPKDQLFAYPCSRI